MIENKDRRSQNRPESRSELISNYRQAFEASQQANYVICEGGFSENNAEETALKFFRTWKEFSSPQFSPIRSEVGFGDRNNDYAPGDYQKTTRILNEIENEGSWRSASIDLLGHGRMVIDMGGGEKECDIQGWNFIKLGLYLQPRIVLFQPEARLEQESPRAISIRSGLESEEDVGSATDVRNSDLISSIENATENEITDQLKKELTKFVRRRTLRQKIKDGDIPLLLNLKMVRLEADKRDIKSASLRRSLLEELLGNFITGIRDRDRQSGSEDLAESEILVNRFVQNMLEVQVAVRLDIPYPTSFKRKCTNAIGRLAHELIILELSERSEPPNRY